MDDRSSESEGQRKSRWSWAAFRSSWFHRNRDDLLRHADRTSPRAVDPEDAVQEGIVKALKAEHPAHSESHFVQRAKQTIVQVGRDMLDWKKARKRGGDRDQVPLPPSSLHPQDDTTGPATKADQRERVQRMRDALMELDVVDRTIVLMRIDRHLEFSEIGRRQGMSADAARMRFQRARSVLKTKFPA